MMFLLILSVSACNSDQATPAAAIEVTRLVAVPQPVPVTRVVPVTRLVPVTRVVEGAPLLVEVTRLVEGPPVVEVVIETVVETVIETVIETVEVEVPQEVTRIVEVEVPVECPTCASPPEASASTADGGQLVWYDFEGDFLASGVVVDRTGNGHDAQVVGAVAAASGVSGHQAISFSGNGYVQASSNPAAGRDTVSFSLWFKTDHPENNYKLASAAWWSGGPGSGWIMATHIPEFWSDDTHSLYLPDISNRENHFPAGEWVHEVVTYDGYRIREYTNGQLINDWSTTAAALGAGEAMVVGAWPPYSGFNFQGSIDEFRVFGWALTAQEVQALYNQR
jgi:hypothetical protein